MTDKPIEPLRLERVTQSKAAMANLIEEFAGIDVVVKLANLKDLRDPNDQFLLFDTLALYAKSAVGSGPIVPVPRQLVETVNLSNRIVSLILDGQLHFGTGILVGPSHVLTPAHLLFEDDGPLIDRSRSKRITVEAHTTYAGNIVMEGPRRTTTLYNPASNDDWLIDPKIPDSTASRDVRDRDFVILRLTDAIGRDPIGNNMRGWVEIPTQRSAPVLSPELAVRVFQFLDRNELLSSSGFVRGIDRNGFRVLHTASTAESASGAAIVDDEFRLVAMHIGGFQSGERPKSNRGLPIRRVAEVIDAVGADGKTIRSKLV